MDDRHLFLLSNQLITKARKKLHSKSYLFLAKIVAKKLKVTIEIKSYQKVAKKLQKSKQFSFCFTCDASKWRLGTTVVVPGLPPLAR